MSPVEVRLVIADGVGGRHEVNQGFESASAALAFLSGFLGVAPAKVVEFKVEFPNRVGLEDLPKPH